MNIWKPNYALAVIKNSHSPIRFSVILAAAADTKLIASNAITRFREVEKLYCAGKIHVDAK